MENIKIHFLNTIWSDAILLEKNNHFAFIDTGSLFYYPMVKKYLNDLNIKNIDFILLTHFHNDHYGNVQNIIEDFNVGKLYMKHYYGLDGTTSSGFASNDEYIENEFKNYNNIISSCKNNNTNIIFMDDLKKEDLEIDFEKQIIEVYDIKNTLYELYSNPRSMFYNQKRFNENFNCVGVFLKVKNNNIFLGADVTCSTTDIDELKDLSIKMINKIYKKHNINHIDLYKSCHHGGGSTNTLDFCALIKPSYTVITNTNRWLDNYPTFENLRKANKDVNILQTDYHKYIFNIDCDITYETIDEESLFITLNKD